MAVNTCVAFATKNHHHEQIHAKFRDVMRTNNQLFLLLETFLANCHSVLTYKALCYKYGNPNVPQGSPLLHLTGTGCCRASDDIGLHHHISRCILSTAGSTHSKPRQLHSDRFWSLFRAIKYGNTLPPFTSLITSDLLQKVVPSVCPSIQSTVLLALRSANTLGTFSSVICKVLTVQSTPIGFRNIFAGIVPPP